MSKANGECNRCKGKGIGGWYQAHLSVPGLCFDCNGSGSYADQAAGKAKRAAAKKREAAVAAVVNPARDKMFAVRRNAEALGYPKASREQHVWMREAGTFSTQAFAEAFGLALRDAWHILCCHSRVGISFDYDALAIRGWAIDYNA